jgi:hypothetical protein
MHKYVYLTLETIASRRFRRVRSTLRPGIEFLVILKLPGKSVGHNLKSTRREKNYCSGYKGNIRWQ